MDNPDSEFNEPIEDEVVTFDDDLLDYPHEEAPGPSFAARLGEWAATAGGCLLYLVFAVGGFFVLWLLFQGVPWFQENVEDWVNLICMGICSVTLPLGLLLVIFRRTRPIGAVGLAVTSYAFGLANWLWCVTVCYYLAGLGWMIFAILWVGIGVYPVAFIASLLSRDWFTAGTIAVSVAAVFGLRGWANYLLDID